MWISVLLILLGSLYSRYTQSMIIWFTSLTVLPLEQIRICDHYWYLVGPPSRIKFLLFLTFLDKQDIAHSFFLYFIYWKKFMINRTVCFKILQRKSIFRNRVSLLCVITYLLFIFGQDVNSNFISKTLAPFDIDHRNTSSCVSVSTSLSLT
jgi:hypothetical protein